MIAICLQFICYRKNRLYLTSIYFYASKSRVETHKYPILACSVTSIFPEDLIRYDEDCNTTQTLVCCCWNLFKILN